MILHLSIINNCVQVKLNNKFITNITLNYVTNTMYLNVKQFYNLHFYHRQHIAYNLCYSLILYAVKSIVKSIHCPNRPELKRKNPISLNHTSSFHLIFLNFFFKQSRENTNNQ